ncbi:MAG: hypothetical protein ACI35S_03760 [Anaeroplasma sp.]
MQNSNVNIPESIWADGCPENIKDEDVLKIEDLHSMAINHVMEKCLLPKGFKPNQNYPRRDFPNIVCKKDGITYAIVVFPSVFPNYVTMQDEFRLQFVEQAKKNNMIPLYAAVGYKSIDEARAKAGLTLKGDVFMTSFPGFIKLTDEPNQNFNVKIEDLFRP